MRTFSRALFWLLIAQSLFMWAAALMRLVSSAPLAVKWGYLCYLTSTLLFLPIVVLSERLLGLSLPGWFLTIQGASWQVWSVFFALSLHRLIQQRNA